ncbi:Pentatricopeptide repeat-containing protein [Raphanus sativus]|uniref:Pentatricopeptide repeat-containing protein At5g19020, mitochondrial n=1 Tax=Raphanus sativus TaxID=3726 RepID=A0A6J0KFY9_RAPSA|nr:pentatricopeptide repeat-containing protein At5g19020, mitochondrial [Raphanus sativus]KAJ4882499.1 Pentatricopeptide repeat-containing protein [Raphanus sativus]
MTRSNRFLLSRRCRVFPQQTRCFSAGITQPSTPAQTPTQFGFSGGESPDTERALVSALGSCAASKDVAYGRQIHCRVLKSGYDSNGFICNSVLNMYAKCRVLSEAESVFREHAKVDSASFNIMIDGYVRSRRLGDALKVFDVMPERSCVSYTTLIKGYAQNDRWSEAMELFREMRSCGVMLNDVTLATVVSACSHLGGVRDCGMLHSLAIRLNLERRVFVSTNLLHMYYVCSCLEDARKLFDEMPERNVVTWNVMLNGYSKAGLVEQAKELFDQISEKDIVSWGTMIDGCLRKNHLEEALVFYKEMLRRGMKPSEVMMVDLLSASARSAGGFNGLQLHCTIVKTGLDCYDFIQATIIHFYAVSSNMKLAIRQFEASVMDHIASRNALIAGFVKNGMVDEAREVFDNTREKDIFSWNAMICGYAQSLSPRLALHLFREMISSSQVKPDAITMVSVFSAISSIGSLEEGIRAHEYLNRSSSIPPNDNLTAAVIDMYAKCGSIETALNVFRQTKNIYSSTISPWNAIICGSATHGHAKLALHLYSELQSLPIKPNSITFVGILSACCHAGLVELGKTYFDSMKSRYGIEPDIKHYGCMADLLGKVGRLEEAIDMIKKMPVKADVIIWGILLSASRIHRNVEVAEMAASELAAIEPTHEGCKVLLSNVYAEAGRWEDVALVREEMRTSDVEWSRAFSGVV